MRAAPSPQLERWRITDGVMATASDFGMTGAFRVPGPLGMSLLVIASDGKDWAECALEGEAWEHVSVSCQRRTPTWAEMEFVRDLFWEPGETVLQFSVPREQHINQHDHCLHLWRPTQTVIPLPPRATV